MRVLLKLLALLAVMMLPVGMSPAAATVPHHQMASMPMRHCPEQSSGHQPKAPFALCTMACSAALPALDQSQPLRLPIACERLRPSLAKQLSTLLPEIATPPPKRS